MPQSQLGGQSADVNGVQVDSQLHVSSACVTHSELNPEQAGLHTHGSGSHDAEQSSGQESQVSPVSHTPLGQGGTVQSPLEQSSSMPLPQMSSLGRTSPVQGPQTLPT